MGGSRGLYEEREKMSAPLALPSGRPAGHSLKEGLTLEVW